MKSVMLSIKPEYCALIANGKKTIEVRKTRPKIEPPFKCYIYCTNDGRPLVYGDVYRGSWESEYVQTFGYSRAEAERIWGVMNGKVIGEFVCDTFVTDKTYGHDEMFNMAACMSEDTASAYSAGSPLYGWHVSDMKIYDEPKLTHRFYRYCGESPKCEKCEFLYRESNESVGFYEECCSLQEGFRPLTSPPQSWCYVEELE